MNGIVIVGAGYAGLRAGLSARKSGFEGRITLVDEASAWPPYERPPLSKWGEDGVKTKPIVPTEQLDAADLSFRQGRVHSIDTDERSLSLVSGEEIRFDKLLLATGADARKLPRAMTLRSKADADAICAKAPGADRALIIGAGFIGLELAASLRAKGVAVHVIEQAPRILMRGTTPAIASIVQRRHEAEGVTFALNRVLRQDEIAEADLVVAGIGSSPAVFLAEQAGITVENGILVDRQMRTSAPDIFAAGDCCAMSGDTPVRLEAWTAAGQQGEIAGHNMAVPDDPQVCMLTPWVWSDQYDLVLQSAGLQNDNQDVVERSYGANHHVSFGLTDGKLAYAVGIAPGVKIAKDIRLAMKLIEKGATVDSAALADPTVALKTLLRS